MASTGRGRDVAVRALTSRGMYRPINDGPATDSEPVPPSLAAIAPILRVANDIQDDNPRVAYLCRFHAFEKTQFMDPTSSGKGVRKFETYLLRRLENEEMITEPKMAKTDPKEIQMYYQKFYEDNIIKGEGKKTPDEMAKLYQIATILYDVLKSMVPQTKIDEKTRAYAEEVERKKEQYEHYDNILKRLYKSIIKRSSRTVIHSKAKESRPLQPARSLFRGMMMDHPNKDGPATDSEPVPPSLAAIAPVLQLANDIQDDNPRVAYLCIFHAFDKAHSMDPTASGQGVRQFKTYLFHRLEKEERVTQPQLAKSDPKEIQMYYQKFYEDNIIKGEGKKTPHEMAKLYQIATILYDVVKSVVPQSKIDEQTRMYAGEVERKKEQYEHYNNTLMCSNKSIISTTLIQSKAKGRQLLRMWRLSWQKLRKIGRGGRK